MRHLGFSHKFLVVKLHLRIEFYTNIQFRWLDKTLIICQQ